jgi:hypothetical protein
VRMESSVPVRSLIPDIMSVATPKSRALAVSDTGLLVTAQESIPAGDVHLPSPGGSPPTVCVPC